MLKTFLVEDEVVIREMIKKMIPWEQYGFELAGEASDGEMALPLILKSKPDLLITDIKMPFMDGLTLCKLVKKELPNIKIVILSGYDDFNYAKQAVDFIDGHYMDEEISLNKVAHVANVSANHFSALFSQNMGQTFIEYLTSLRMSKAKELLRCTAKRSSEIAGEVGYKDAHYFSYLFKKTQKMTPSEYRKTRGEV